MVNRIRYKHNGSDSFWDNQASIAKQLILPRLNQCQLFAEIGFNGQAKS